jgi:hypothetical protein
LEGRAGLEVTKAFTPLVFRGVKNRFVMGPAEAVPP